jgi:hypothetical protein
MVNSLTYDPINKQINAQTNKITNGADFFLRHVLSRIQEIAFLSMSFVAALSIFSNGATAPSGPGSPHYRGFTITFRHTTLGRNPLDEWSARRRDLYLTTHNTDKRQTSMPSAGFEPTIPASERPQTHTLNRAASEIGPKLSLWLYGVDGRWLTMSMEHWWNDTEGTRLKSMWLSNLNLCKSLSSVTVTKTTWLKIYHRHSQHSKS